MLNIAKLLVRVVQPVLLSYVLVLKVGIFLDHTNNTAFHEISQYI